MLQQGLSGLDNTLKHIYCEIKDVREAAQAQQRALSFEFGVVDITDNPRIGARRLASLPVIVEASATERTEINVEKYNQGRAVSRGFYANLGDSPFRVILVGVGGQVSAPHTLPPSTTISLTCLISKVIIDPSSDGPAVYQLYMQ